jgi:hypothetical protein
MKLKSIFASHLITVSPFERWPYKLKLNLSKIYHVYSQYFSIDRTFNGIKEKIISDSVQCNIYTLYDPSDK